jgi:peptidoglycan/xylan/chitin deacetylase (PgdA/CDA1 family)
MKGRDLAAESMFAYGSRVGFWRLMRLFRERGLPLTVFGCALALERNPRAAAAIVEAGHDVCCHGWRWVKHYALDEATEREHIRMAIESLRRTVGGRPLGWYCRYGPSVNTRRLLMEEGGFLYDSDAYDDELPYWVQPGGTSHLVIPYSLTNNDGRFMAGQVGTGDEFFAFLKDAFDMLWAEGGRMMSVGMHMRLLGHPARAAGLQRFLDYVAGHEGVWITRRLEIAEHWRREFPAPAG